MKIKSISKHVLAIVLSLAVLASTLMLNTFSAFAEEATPALDIWDGTLAVPNEETGHPYDSGTGTELDPYIISTPEQFAYMLIKADWGTTNSIPGGAHYKLLNDIYLNDVEDYENWGTTAPANPWRGLVDNDEELGNNADGKPKQRLFYGHIHGNGKTVYGLYYSGDAYYSGLIYRFGNGASVEDLRISKAYVKSTGWNGSHGVLVGHAWGSTTVKNVVIDETVEFTTGGYGAAVIGGIQDVITQPVTIENCYVAAKLAVSNTRPVSAFLGTPYSDTGNKFDYTTSSHLIIKNSYYVGDKVLANTNATYPVKYVNCYTTADLTETGVTVRTLAQMTGAQALINMNALDFQNVWYTADGKTPQLRFGNKEIQNATKLWKVWDGTVPDKRVSDGTQLWVKENVPFDGGSGTSGDPYKISTPWQLAYLCAYTNWYIEGKYFELTDDIYLNDVSNDAWMEAGNNPHSWVFSTDNNGFRSAHLNGNGHTIYGLYVNKPESFAALFGKITGTSSIENLRISKSYVNNTRDNNYSASAALVGFLNDKATMTINNCVIDDSVQIINASGCVGGFIGNLGNGATINIDKCYSGAMLNQIGNWYVSQCLVRAFVGSRNDVKGATYNISNSYAASDCDLIYSGTNTVSFDKCYTTYADTTETTVTVMQKSEMLSNGLTNVLNVFPKLGNVNGDENADVDICDLVILKKFELGMGVNIDIYSSDVNNDREINGMDFDALQKYILTDATVFQ